MLTVKEYAFATPRELGGTSGYARFCRVAAVPDVPEGWALLLCEDDAGRRSTVATADLGWVELLVTAQDHGVLAGTPLPEHKVDWSRPGWPDTWAA